MCIDVIRIYYVNKKLIMSLFEKLCTWRLTLSLYATERLIRKHRVMLIIRNIDIFIFLSHLSILTDPHLKKIATDQCHKRVIFTKCPFYYIFL